MSEWTPVNGKLVQFVHSPPKYVTNIAFTSDKKQRLMFVMKSERYEEYGLRGFVSSYSLYTYKLSQHSKLNDEFPNDADDEIMVWFYNRWFNYHQKLKYKKTIHLHTEKVKHMLPNARAYDYSVTCSYMRFLVFTCNLAHKKTIIYLLFLNCYAATTIYQQPIVVESEMKKNWVETKTEKHTYTRTHEIKNKIKKSITRRKTMLW